MSRTYKDMRVKVTGRRRRQVDTKKMARLVILLAQAEAEAAAAAEHQNQPTKSSKNRGQPGGR